MHTVAELKALIKKYKEKDCPAISKMKKADLLKFVQEKNLISEKSADKPAEKPVAAPVAAPAAPAKKPGRKPKLMGEGMQKILAGKPLVDPELVNEYEKYKGLPNNYKSMSVKEMDKWLENTDLYEEREREIKIYKKTGKTAAEQRKQTKERMLNVEKGKSIVVKAVEESMKNAKPINDKRVTEALVKMGVIK